MAWCRNVTGKQVLRPRKEKPKKPPAKSNAERLREYKARIKANPILYAEWKEKKKLENQRRHTSLTDERKEIEREKARLRQQECRAKKKAKVVTSTPKRKAQNSQCVAYTRVQAQKAAEKREANRLRQQKRRAEMSAQKRRRINEHRRELYRSRNKTP